MALQILESWHTVEIAYSVNDNSEIKLYPRCGIHKWYYQGQAPTNGCPECWEIFYFILQARTDPKLQEQMIGGLEEAINHMVEYIEAGKDWDVELYPHPIVDVEKNAN